MACACGKNKASNIVKNNLSQSYTLKDPNNLPPAGVFIDPTDNSEYRVQPRETLGNFLERIKTARAEKGLPEFIPTDLKTLVEVSLTQHIHPKDLLKYFELTAIPVQAAQIAGLVRTIISARTKGNAAPSYLKRQDRAHACANCRLHDSKMLTPQKMTRVVEKLIGLKQVEQSAVEEALGTCRMCGCGMKEKIRVSLLNVLAGIEPSRLSMLLSAYGTKAFDTCWIFKESLEDPALAKLLKTKIEKSSPHTQGFYQQYLAEKKHGSQEEN